MLSINLTAGATTTNIPVGITKGISTNNNLAVVNNSIEILIPGIYELIGNVTVTSTAADDYGMSAYVNGELQGIASVNLATGASETTTIPMYSLIEITEATTGFATMEFMPVGTPTIVGGTISIKKIV